MPEKFEEKTDKSVKEQEVKNKSRRKLLGLFGLGTAAVGAYAIFGLNPFSSSIPPKPTYDPLLIEDFTYNGTLAEHKQVKFLDPDTFGEITGAKLKWDTRYVGIYLGQDSWPKIGAIVEDNYTKLRIEQQPWRIRGRIHGQIVTLTTVIDNQENHPYLTFKLDKEGETIDSYGGIVYSAEYKNPSDAPSNKKWSTDRLPGFNGRLEESFRGRLEKYPIKNLGTFKLWLDFDVENVRTIGDRSIIKLYDLKFSD